MDSDPEEEVMIEPKVQPKIVPAQKDWASLIVKMKPDAPKGALKKKPTAKIRAVTKEEEARQSWHSAQLVPTKHYEARPVRHSKARLLDVALARALLPFSRRS